MNTTSWNWDQLIEASFPDPYSQITKSEPFQATWRQLHGQFFTGHQLDGIIFESLGALVFDKFQVASVKLTLFISSIQRSSSYKRNNVWDAKCHFSTRFMNSQAIRTICRGIFLQIHRCTNICLPTGSLGLCWSKTIGISAVACFHPSWFLLHQCQHIFWSQSRWSTKGSATLVGILRPTKSRKRNGRKLTCFAGNTNDTFPADAYVKDVNDPYINEITYILLWLLCNFQSLHRLPCPASFLTLSAI